MEDIFHVAGTPNDGSLRDESITINPYLLNMSCAGSGSWKMTSFVLQQPTVQPGSSTISPAGAYGPTASVGPAVGAPPSVSRAAIRHAAKPAAPQAQAAASAPYSPSAAWNYAAAWWYRYNPAYPQYGDDCQNFASETVHAGGFPEVYYAWDPGLYDWINTAGYNSWAWNSGIYNFLSYVSSLRTGDVLQIAWNGGSTPNHAMFVDGVQSGVQMLAAHTNAEWNYPVTTIEANYPHATYWAIHPN